MISSNLDAFVGTKLTEFRRGAGISQRELADKLGLSPQQISKYETGMDKISAGRLFEISNLLGVKLAEFFRGFQ